MTKLVPLPTSPKSTLTKEQVNAKFDAAYEVGLDAAFSMAHKLLPKEVFDLLMPDWQMDPPFMEFASDAAFEAAWDSLSKSELKLWKKAQKTAGAKQ